MHIIEWLVQNVIGKVADLFLGILRVFWRLTKPIIAAIDHFVTIGFWPSLVLASVSFVLWNSIGYYELTKEKDNIEATQYRRKLKIFLQLAFAHIALASFLLISIYNDNTLRVYGILTMCYIAVFVKVFFFICEMLDKRDAERS